MILRDVLLSRDRHRLGAESPLPSPLPAEAKASPRLTLADVIAWLSSDTESSRRACAGVLATDLEEVRAAARAAGFAAGEAAALIEIERRHAAALSHLASVAIAVERSNQRAMESLANDCAAIVAEVFSKLAGPLLVTPAAALGAVRAVLERVRDGRCCTMYVHPLDMAAVEAERGTMQSALGLDRLDLQADAALASGGCRMESDLGALDADFDAQLRALYDTLRIAHVARVVEP